MRRTYQGERLRAKRHALVGQFRFPVSGLLLTSSNWSTGNGQPETGNRATAMTHRDRGGRRFESQPDA
jgi:hypothetical protein